MDFEIIKGKDNAVFSGCDFVVRLPKDRENTKIKILQLTDTQVIDSRQRRYPDRIRADEISAWRPEKFDIMCGNHIRSLVAQTKPDLIILTGDIIYGSFDDKGTTFEWFCKLMDSLKTPWAPVFGNHDNESERGVSWQCERFAESEYCLFERGTVTGNGNYTVGIAVGDTLVRVLHMIDSNGCKASEDAAVTKTPGIYGDQLELIRANTEKIELAQKRKVPAFMAFHIPVSCFREAERAKGYQTEEREFYTIGVDVDGIGEDFGFNLEKYTPIEVGDEFIDFVHSQNINGVFVGHIHKCTTAIDYKDVKWVFGFKTGQYDYHVPGQIGGTLITLLGGEFSVLRIPALVHFGPMPRKAKIFNDFFADESEA